MPKVTWPQFNKTVEVSSGTTILDCAMDHDIPLEHACGGFCACTTCHVHVTTGAENVSVVLDDEQERLETVDHHTKQSRLGCQSQIKGDVTVVIPGI